MWPLYGRLPWHCHSNIQSHVRALQGSRRQRVDGVLEVRQLHDLVVANRQQGSRQHAGGAPWARATQSFPLECQAAGRLLVRASILTPAGVLEDEGAVERQLNGNDGKTNDGGHDQQESPATEIIPVCSAP